VRSFRSGRRWVPRRAEEPKNTPTPIIRLAVCREKRDDAKDAPPKLTPGYPHVDGSECLTAKEQMIILAVEESERGSVVEKDALFVGTGVCRITPLWLRRWGCSERDWWSGGLGKVSSSALKGLKITEMFFFTLLGEN
jgi:hypothetical protein